MTSLSFHKLKSSGKFNVNTGKKKVRLVKQWRATLASSRLPVAGV
jgi:hypothetical protein